VGLGVDLGVDVGVSVGLDVDVGEVLIRVRSEELGSVGQRLGKRGRGVCE
jgi:hypothetical protein